MKKVVTNACFFALTLGIYAAIAHGAQPLEFRAGAAASNITPPLGEPIVGGWESPPGEHIHDELYARCLVLDDGETRLAIVICDNLGIAREVYDTARQLILKETGILEANVMMAATHTHSSIIARGTDRAVYYDRLSPYQKFLASRIADGVRRAVNNLEPAQIGCGSVQEPTQVFNRRWFMKPGTPIPNPFGGQDKVVMNPGRGNPDLDKPAGPTDPEIAFLAVRSKAGRPIALLANYSLHYVGTQAVGVISADYFGVFCDRIQQLLGADRLDPPFVGMLSNGTSADINNINWPQKPTGRPGPYVKMREVGEKVAQVVFAAYETTEFRDWTSLATSRSELTLSVRKPTVEQVAYAKGILAKPAEAEPYHKREIVYADRTLNLTSSPDKINILLQVFRIGDLGICAIPFETFVEIGLEIKETSPFAKAFTISHANGTSGYLPTERQHKFGGYETWLGTCFVETSSASGIVSELMRMMRGMN
jgi:hypothetical protein